MTADAEDTFNNRVKDIVLAWLEPEFSIKDLPAGVDVSWVIQANDGKRNVLILSLKRAGDHLILEGRVSLSDVHQAQLQAMEPAARKRWQFQLQRDLTAMGLDFGMNAPLTLINVQQHVYVDGGLVKDTFMQRLHDVRHGVAFIQSTVQQQFD